MASAFGNGPMQTVHTIVSYQGLHWFQPHLNLHNLQQEDWDQSCIAQLSIQ